MEENVQEQRTKQRKWWIEQYQFQKGVSGNPGGRPKGSKSMKTYAREYLESLSDEEKLEFLSLIEPDVVWKMADGNPHNTEDINAKGEIKLIPIFNGQSVQEYNGDTKSLPAQKED